MSSTTSSTTDTLSVRTIVLGTLVVLLAMGVRATFGLFMQPMGLAHGWSREVFSMAFALQNLVWGCLLYTSLLARLVERDEFRGGVQLREQFRFAVGVVFDLDRQDIAIRLERAVRQQAAQVFDCLLYTSRCV